MILALSFGLLAAITPPLHFEPNRGQTPDRAVQFAAEAKGYSFGVTDREARLPGGVRMRWKAKAREVVAEAPLGGHSNYIEGNDPAKWVMDVPHYGRIRAREIEPGVDIVFYGGAEDGRKLEYDLEVAAGADAGNIRLEFVGARSVKLDAASGDLLVETDVGLVRQHKPVVRQGPANIAGNCRIVGRDQVAFSIGSYDRTRPLVIDPVLVWSISFGGSAADYGKGIALDNSGNVYITGTTYSRDFQMPNSPNSSSRPRRAFVTKYDPSGTTILYTTFLSGSRSDDGNAIAVDGQGNVYVAGSTESTDFPTKGAVQSVFGGGIYDAFVAKLSPNGALIYSTFLGGPNVDYASAIAIDASGSAYVAGQTWGGFPVSPGAIQSIFKGTAHAFVTRLSPSGETIAFSTYLGGVGSSWANGIAVDTTGVYVGGSTYSGDFPVLRPMQGCSSFQQQGFLAKLIPSGGSFVFSTCIGGSSDTAINGLDVDPAGAVYLTGGTNAKDFPVVNPVVPVPTENLAYAFVSKVKPDGSGFVYSTYLGGGQGKGIRVDSSGRASAVGNATSANFPTASALEPALGTGGGFLSQFSPAGALEASTFVGVSSLLYEVSGVAIDQSSEVYLVGTTPEVWVSKIARGGPPSVPITVVSAPPGLNVMVDGATIATPRIFQWLVGSAHFLSTTSNSLPNNMFPTFTGWNIGQNDVQQVTAPAAATTYTATFTVQPCTFSWSKTAARYGALGTPDRSPSQQITTQRVASGTRLRTWPGFTISRHSHPCRRIKLTRVRVRDSSLMSWMLLRQAPCALERSLLAA